jgi:curved DNA-binding protein CbpA
MDPHAVLGVAPGASAADLAAAYRREAKRWHPDRGDREDAQARMAAVNAA